MYVSTSATELFLMVAPPWALMRELGIAFDERLMPFMPGSSWAEFRKFSPADAFPASRTQGDGLDSLGSPNFSPNDTRPSGRRMPRREPGRGAPRRDALRLQRAAQPLRHELRHPRASQRVPPELEKEIARLDELWREVSSASAGHSSPAKHSRRSMRFTPVAFRVQTYDLSSRSPHGPTSIGCWRSPRSRAGIPRRSPETWREPAHEEEAKAAGAWLPTFRRVG